MKLFILLMMTISCTLASAQEEKVLDNSLTYTLDSCRTIDKRLMKKCREILKTNMENVDSALHAEVLVMDTESGHIKAWVALEDQNGRIKDAELRKNHVSLLPLKYVLACASLSDANISLNDMVDTKCGVDSVGSFLVRDHNWRRGGYGRVTYKEAFTKHSDIAMAKAMYTADPSRFLMLWHDINNSPRVADALQVSAFYNVIANKGIVIVPSVNTDSVHIEINDDDFPTSRQVDICRKVLKATLQEDGIGSSWTTKKVDIAGNYAVHHIYQPALLDENVGEAESWHTEEFHCYDQIIFTGYLPSDKPRYTICVVMDRKGMESSGKTISYTVNTLAEYLNRH